MSNSCNNSLYTKLNIRIQLNNISMSTIEILIYLLVHKIRILKHLHPFFIYIKQKYFVVFMLFYLEFKVTYK